jgi:homoserine dehydrogenase
VKLVSISELRTRYYLRITVADKPGVLAHLAASLGDAQISIASVLQKEVEGEGEGRAEVVIMTHEAREADMQQALGRIRALPQVIEIEQVLRVFA